MTLVLVNLFGQKNKMFCFVFLFKLPSLGAIRFNFYESKKERLRNTPHQSGWHSRRQLTPQPVTYVDITPDCLLRGSKSSKALHKSDGAPTDSTDPTAPVQLIAPPSPAPPSTFHVFLRRPPHYPAITHPCPRHVSHCHPLVTSWRILP